MLPMRRNYSHSNVTLFSRFPVLRPVRLSSFCYFALSQTEEPKLEKCALRAAKLFALECYVVFAVPCVAACAVILLLLFCALSDLRAQAGEMRPQSCLDDSWRCLHSSHLFFNLSKNLAAHWRCFRCLQRCMQLCLLLDSKKIIGTW